jgi:trissin receptor
VILAVWITSAVYSIPKFIFVRTITNNLEDGTTETICVASRKLYNSKVFDMINFAMLYVLPLLVMMVSRKKGKNNKRTKIERTKEWKENKYKDKEITKKELFSFLKRKYSELRILPSIFFGFQILYSRIAITLWKSSRGLEQHVAKHSGPTHSSANNHLSRKLSSKYEKKALGATDSQVLIEKIKKKTSSFSSN